MDEHEYIEQRLIDQCNWYDRKSQLNQRWHKGLQIILILSAASIPFLSTIITTQSCLNIITGALGVLIAVISGIVALYKFDEKWIKYRTTAESLKHEQYLYLTRVVPYDVENAFPLLVQRVETLISQENRDWSQNIIKSTDKNKT